MIHSSSVRRGLAHPAALLCGLLVALAGCGGDGTDLAANGSAAGAASGPAAAPASAPASAPPVKIAITAKGTALGPVVAAVIGAAGGSLTSVDDRLSITIPPGALAADTPISIQLASNEAPNGVGLAYRLLPDGQTFALPVRLSVRYDESDVAGSNAQAFALAFQDNQRRWIQLDRVLVDEPNKSVSGEMPHFTDVALLTGYVMRPASASLALNEFRGFFIDLCYAVEFNAIACTVSPVDGFQLSVNGILNGSSSVGTVNPGSSSLYVAYTAPAVVPAANPVALQAATTNAFINRGQQTVLVSNIWISSYAPLGGTILSTQISPTPTGTITHTTFAQTQFRYQDDSGTYRPESSPASSLSFYEKLTSHIDGVDRLLGCSYHVEFLGRVSANGAYIKIEENDGPTPRYEAGGLMLGKHTGTTNCNPERRVVPMTLEFGEVFWWPAPPPAGSPGGMTLRALDNGSLRGFVEWTPGPGGAETRVIWNLNPNRRF